MTRIGTLAAALAAGCLAAAVPVQANPTGDAEKLRRLDIMLMVTALRCRTTPDDFRAEFQRFEANHIKDLNSAAADLRDSLIAKHGVSGATRQLDRISTSMANQYGQGHPWLGCRELKQSARLLANVRGRAALVEAAGQLLSPTGEGGLAFARR